ncbi:cysteine desulfurase family protein [Cerasicoccus maritimus]|uniref:cysteine desulfurase family protein n=1 Tax=Cerasicoccus maritimus TaxID=490089 RepID=UPI0028529490|nr:cysteine desulfurase family protein [Cerasicoccus maritimus]
MSLYFDANATTPLLPEAREAWLAAVDEHWQNPSSPSRASARVHVLLEQSRTKIADRFGVSAESVVFNSGATEGNRDVLAYMRRIAAPGQQLAQSAIEHPSVRENAQEIWSDDALELPVDEQGRISLEYLDETLALGKFALVSLMAANNETGVVQPWREAIDLCHRRRVAIHVDATQWVGKEPLAGLGSADFVTVSGHKFGGPKGAGFLIVAPAFSGFAGQRGGAQEHDHRAGTENYPAVAAMMVALKVSDDLLRGDAIQACCGRDAFEAKLLANIEGLQIWGQGAPRLANTSSLCLPGHENSRWVRLLEQRGFVVSTGSACATGKAGPSHVLAAMGISPECALQTVRVSSLRRTVAADWDLLAKAFIDLSENGGSATANSQVISI